MIDLSHLTEEEQGMIMTVLRRDAELKKAEEERVRKLEKVLNSNSSQSDIKMKYMTGEWFYEAKSRRHNDKIHGSEIILASMKQGKTASLDGSLRLDKSKLPSSRGSDIVAPPKPSRSLEATQPQEINDAEKENRFSDVRSPRMPRHNPFNRASLIVVDPPDYNHDNSTGQTQEPQEREHNASQKNASAVPSNLTPGNSVPNESSPAGFRPIPKKRTFVSRRSVSHIDSNGQPGIDTQVRPVVPAPRRSLQRGASVNSDQLSLKNTDETLQRNQAAQPAQQVRSLDANVSSPPCDAASSNTNVERERNQPSYVARERPPPYCTTNLPAKKEAPLRSEGPDVPTQREQTATHSPSKLSGELQEKNNSNRMGTGRRDEDSLSQSSVDPTPPVSYKLNFVDKSNQQTHKTSPRHVFKLSKQTTSSTGDEEESIVKVLDWFSRSTDSSVWLNAERAPMRQDEELLGREAKNDVCKSDRERETLQGKSSHVQKPNNGDSKPKAMDRKGSKGLTEAEEVRSDAKERTCSQDVRDNADESQPLKISNLKSFWEKSNTDPKILINKSATPGEKRLNSSQLSVDDETDMQFVPGINIEKGIHDKFSSDWSDEREQQVVNSPQIKMGGRAQLNNHQQVENWMISSTHMTDNDSAYTKLLSNAHRVEREPETERVAQIISSDKTTNDSASEKVSAKSKPQPEVMSESRESIQEEHQSKILSAPQLDAHQHAKVIPDYETHISLRNLPHMDFKPSGDDVQITNKEKGQELSSEDLKRRDSEDKSVHSSTSKRKEEKTNPPPLTRQDSTAEKIKQLKTFWEKERNKSTFYTGRSKTSGESKLARGANLAKLNKRFTKSEFDLSSIGKEVGSDEDGIKKHPNFTILPLNQRLDKMSPSLGASRSQFNTLREFWDEATSDSRGSLTLEKPKNPKRKEPVGPQLSSSEFNMEVYCVNPAVEKTKSAAVKSSVSPQNRPKSPHDRQIGSGSRLLSDGKNTLPTQQPRRSSKDSSREERFIKTQTTAGKEVRVLKTRKDSFGFGSSYGNSLRRATSMFSLSGAEEKDPNQLRPDITLVHMQSRKHRQNIEKGSLSKRLEDAETVAPRARAFVPTDYRHYLGMTDNTSIHASLTPTVKNEGSEVKTGYELDTSGPGRSSTPMNQEERHIRKSSKIIQRPAWANYGGPDAGQESAISNPAETWSTARNTANRENYDDNQNSVKKALWRAEARPKNLAKSMEDITASLAPRQERRPDPSVDHRRGSDVSTITTPSSSSFSDPDHLKKMSKSVPSFLQKELSGSVMTMYSGDIVEVQGNIQFSINYVQRLKEFHIFVVECQGLAAVDPKRNRSDPYVKSYLVPDKDNLGKRKTSVKKKTLNPAFNEILRYRVRMEYLRTQTLILSVWHHDTFGKNSFLGEVDVDLSKWDFDHTQMNYLPLKARTPPAVEPSNVRGEMKLAVRFLPQISHSEGVTKDVSGTGEVHIWVKECKNLPLIRTTIDPYVKCFVLPDTSRKSRQKTRVLRRTVDPVFNHTMVYDGIGEADLTEACVELTVWDRDRLASNLLGGLRLGAGTGRSYGSLVDWMDSSPHEVALWERMMASPNEWVEDVLPLRMLNSAKTAFK